MTIEKLVSFGVKDLNGVAITCPGCGAVVALPFEKGLSNGTLYCPRCGADENREQTAKIWTAQTNTTDQQLVRALFDAWRAGKSAVKMVGRFDG